MHRIRAALLVLSLAVTASLTGPVFAADAGQGEVLARRWCATCHVVASGQVRGSTQAPPFSEVARTPGFDAARLALFLLAPHPRMPDMTLSRAEAADLAAYIANQR